MGNLNKEEYVEKNINLLGDNLDDFICATLEPARSIRENMICEPVGADMYLLYNIVFPEKRNFVILNDYVVNKYGIKVDKARALENTARFFPPTLYTLDGAITPIGDGEKFPKHGLKFVGTSEEGFMGAVSIFCPGVDEKIKAAIGENKYYLLPSSRYELIIVPASDKNDTDTEEDFIKALREIVNSVNPTLEAGEYLGSEPFIYNKGVLEKA